jgi:hypothetical protein
MDEDMMLVRFIGVKIVNAKPMTRMAWMESNNKAAMPPADEPGYLVIYQDGYRSWCPKRQFEEANKPLDSMPFGHAIEAARLGKKIARSGWNGKGMFVAFMPALSLPPFSSQAPGAKVNDRTAKFIGENTPLDSQPYFAMWTAQGKWQPGWLASQSDMLADDWMVVSE